jgi:hypothetical protein
MLSEKIKGPRGDKILAVIYLNGRRRAIVIQAELPGDPTAIAEIAEDKPR